LGSRTWVQFWMSGRNRFDLFLVVATCIIQLPMIQGSSAYKYLTIFQCLRFYRLILCLPRVRRLLSSAIGSGEGVINVGLFLLWSTALFAPISMQLFGGDFGFMDYDEQELRFDTFLQAFLSLFDVSFPQTHCYWMLFSHSSNASIKFFSYSPARTGL